MVLTKKSRKNKESLEKWDKGYNNIFLIANSEELYTEKSSYNKNCVTIDIVDDENNRMYYIKITGCYLFSQTQTFYRTDIYERMDSIGREDFFSNALFSSKSSELIKQYTEVSSTDKQLIHICLITNTDVFDIIGEKLNVSVNYSNFHPAERY